MENADFPEHRAKKLFKQFFGLGKIRALCKAVQYALEIHGVILTDCMYVGACMCAWECVCSLHVVIYYSHSFEASSLSLCRYTICYNSKFHFLTNRTGTILF